MGKKNCTSPKSICVFVDKTIVEHVLKTLTLHNFCIQYPNVTFFGVLEAPLICQQVNKKIL